MLALVTILALSEVITTQMVVNTIISLVVGWSVWWLRKRITDRQTLVAEAARAAIERQLSNERDEKNRLSDEASKLEIRVATTEKLLIEFQERLAVMDSQQQPLFEAAKKRLINSLTHPDAEFKVPDKLLDDVRGPEGRMSPELAAALKERALSNNPKVSPEEKLAAEILPAIMLLAEAETRAIGPVIMQLVSYIEKKEK